MTLSFTLLTSKDVKSNNDSISTYKFWLVTAVESAGYVGSYVVLNEMWYKPFPKSKFHFFNDNAEWRQMDKIGHYYTTYHLSRVNYGLYKLVLPDHKKAAITSSLLSWLYMSSVEFLDGRSVGWGFSWGDVAFNTLGAASFAAQECLWEEQRILSKFSYHQTDHPQFNSKVLGQTGMEQVVKNYNGQTYWLSGNPFHFNRETESPWPQWLNVAIGYSAHDMIRGSDHYFVQLQNNEALTFKSHRQWFLSLDLNLDRIPTQKNGSELRFQHSKPLKFLFQQ